MKQALFISYFFPPIYSVESTMALNSVKYLNRFGWEPIVLTATASKEFGADISGRQLLPKELRIVRTPSWENWWSRGLNWLGLVPDAMFGWQKSAIRTSRIIRQRYQLSAIISRANPITSHLIAEVIYHRFKQKTPWIVLFGDPWTQNPYVVYRWPWVKPYREWIEQRIVKKADAIVVTTDLTKELLASKYGQAEKIHVLPNTYDPAEFANLITANLIQPTTTMAITHAGNFYGLRSPESLFMALQLVKREWPEIATNIKVRLIGSLGKFGSLVQQYQLADLIEVVGILPRQQTLQELAQSQVLLSIDAAQPAPSIFLPGKLVDYLALGKPILALTPTGTVTNIMFATQAGLVADPTDPMAIASAIKQLYQKFQTGNLSVQPNLKTIEQYSAPCCAEKLAGLLNQLVESKNS